MNNKKRAEKLIEEIRKDDEIEFKKTEKILRALEGIIETARIEKWYPRHLIEELEVDIDYVWKEKIE